MLFSNYLLKWFSLLFTMNTSNSHICIYIFYHVTNHSLYDLCANKFQSDPFVKFFIWKWDQLHSLSSTIFAVYTFFCFVFGSIFVTLHLLLMIDLVLKLTLTFFHINLVQFYSFIAFRDSIQCSLFSTSEILFNFWKYYYVELKKSQKL